MNLNAHELLANNWSSSSSLCNWIGITCDARHGRVKALNLSNMGLIGNMPPELGNLSFLSALDLSNNRFYGDLPKELLQLHRVKLLDLSDNGFSGQIPPWLGGLNELQHLSLQNNSFGGFLPLSIANLSKLENLNLGANLIGGNIPIVISHLYQLKILNIARNKLLGSIPAEIFNISSLEVLILGHNLFSGKISIAVGALPKLKVLDLQDNKLSEYGSKGIISTRGDIYSYGILMLEMFTRKKPTDEMFTAELNLKRWVTDLMPHAAQIVDSNLLQEEGQQIDDMITCATTILEMALNCCADLPEARVSMTDVVASLNKVKMVFMQKSRARAM
ncbi:hypothetical protein L6164_037450 [Bauhinia variegata]|uniref:Uncharacterized protein n=1 Tax=Bauhinia variegata TaxID=167791 RepID=A0ACB9KJX6_BAUVA|nr:hypothetical protein L6164_037450 [Bauhinia variegata]